MSSDRIKVRANRSTGELEIEGPAQLVEAWWTRLSSELTAHPNNVRDSIPSNRQVQHVEANGRLPELFGEFFGEFQTNITDLDKVLVAAAYVQGRDAEHSFTTKSANQLLLDQNIKVANASENVRRLTQSKRVFVVSDGKYRVSANGFEHLNTLKL
jgi:hypothetical protein